MLQVQFINTIFIIVEAACPSVLRSTLSAKYRLRKTESNSLCLQLW